MSLPFKSKNVDLQVGMSPMFESNVSVRRIPNIMERSREICAPAERTIMTGETVNAEIAVH